MEQQIKVTESTLRNLQSFQIAIARAKEVLAQLEGQEEIIIPKRVEVKVQEQEVIPEPVVVKKSQ